MENNFEFFDIHSHLNIESLYKEREDVMRRMAEDRIGTICVGTDLEHSRRAVAIANEYSSVWATIGQHPADNHAEEFVMDEYEKLLDEDKNNKIVAIGECGLDYYRLEGENIDEIKNKQKELFIKHIELAIKYNKPLMIHARPAKAGQGQAGNMDAYEEVISILDEFNPPVLVEEGGKGGGGVNVNFHFFVGNIEIAKKIVEHGWTVSFDGPITFSHDYDEVIKFVPIENIMCETDAPFAAPAPHRGQTNYPYYVPNIYEAIAKIKGLELEFVQNKIRENVKRVFWI